MQERSARLPEVPTIAESGFPDYLAAAWYGFAVPKGTPPEIVAKLREATVAATKTDTVKRSLDVEGAVVIGNTPEEFASFMQGESQALGRADQVDRVDHGLSCKARRNAADVSGAIGRTVMATSFEKPRDLVGGLVIVAIGGVFLAVWAGAAGGRRCGWGRATSRLILSG